MYKIRSRGKVVFHPVGKHHMDDWRWIDAAIDRCGILLAGRWVERVLVIEKTALPRHCELALCQPRLSLPCDQQLLWQSWWRSCP